MSQENMSEQRMMHLFEEWRGQSAPPAGLLEERVLEMETLGLLDEEETPGEPSSVRMFAMASLLHHKPPYFVTLNAKLLENREMLESRYGLLIFSLSEALMLLHDGDGPLN
jgi:hypothetical protein